MRSPVPEYRLISQLISHRRAVVRGIQLQRSGQIAIMVSLGLVASSFMRAAPAAQENGLQQRLAVLEAQVATLTQQLAAATQNKIVSVNCGAGERIQTAITDARLLPQALIINVFGVCSENVVVRRNGFTMIQAGGPGAGIAAANGTQPVVSTSAFAVRFALIGLTISGGNTGVFVDWGSHAEVANCILSNNGTAVDVRTRSLIQLFDTVMEDNAVHGIDAGSGSHVFMGGGAIRNNASDGFVLSGGATALIDGAAQIASNGAYGLWLNQRSQVTLRNSTITGSAFSGALVNGGSTLALDDGAVITANTRNGVSLTDTSVLQKRRGLIDIHVTNNGQYGVSCSPSPAVAMLAGFTGNVGDISGNPAGDVNCPMSPAPPGG